MRAIVDHTVRFKTMGCEGGGAGGDAKSSRRPTILSTTLSRAISLSFATTEICTEDDLFVTVIFKFIVFAFLLLMCGVDDSSIDKHQVVDRFLFYRSLRQVKVHFYAFFCSKRFRPMLFVSLLSCVIHVWF